MTTKKKIEVAPKPKATKTKIKEAPPPKNLSDAELAMKLGANIIKKGSHLTVTFHPNGKQTLEWDDEALLRDVREAIESIGK